MFRNLGFDSDFDLTAADTRAQGRTRAVVAVVVFASGLTVIDWRAMAVWAAFFVLGDGLLWIATSPTNQSRRPVPFRILRLVSTAISTSAWVGAGVLWWFSGEPYAKAAGVALISGVLIYMIRGCHKSLVQALVTATPPAVVLLILPFFEDTWRARLGLLTCMGMLVAYAVSSAISALRAYAQLRATTAALIVKQREAEAASVAKSEFLANMSHEIRTPLNGVLAMAHVLAKASLPPREQEAARLICTSSETLQRLLADVLDLAKVEAGQLEIHRSSFHAGDLVRNVANLNGAAAEANGVGLSISIDPACDRWVEGDDVRIRQVLTNLLSNAVKFTLEGSVALSLSKTSGGRLRFCVEDTGVGFGPDQKARIFERFQQADGTITRRFGGTGLGLSISRHLVEMMEGEIDCFSTPGQGSTFWFELDLPEVEPERETEHAIDEPLAWPRRVLVVDDHPTNVQVVKIILGGAGISVTTAANGAEAVSIWSAEKFDLVLMDMQMPVMDGLSAVGAIREAEARLARVRTPVIMLTANTSADHVAAGVAAGADGHLSKPITPSALFDAMSAVSHPDEADPAPARAAAL